MFLLFYFYPQNCLYFLKAEWPALTPYHLHSPVGMPLFLHYHEYSTFSYPCLVIRRYNFKVMEDVQTFFLHWNKEKSTIKMPMLKHLIGLAFRQKHFSGPTSLAFSQTLMVVLDPCALINTTIVSCFRVEDRSSLLFLNPIQWSLMWASSKNHGSTQFLSSPGRGNFFFSDVVSFY